MYTIFFFYFFLSRNFEAWKMLFTNMSTRRCFDPIEFDFDEKVLKINRPHSKYSWLVLLQEMMISYQKLIEKAQKRKWWQTWENILMISNIDSICHCILYFVYWWCLSVVGCRLSVYYTYVVYWCCCFFLD